MAETTYSGDVCYQDGWHMSVVKDAAGHDVPGERLFLEDDGSYRLAVDGDLSWHDRHHQRFVNVVMEDGSQSEQVSAEEFAAIQDLLKQKRGEV